jgi:7,8-dihydroneopterin aldolase/epimerase/oxygenase
MWFIALKDCQFQAKHGVYKQEQILGNSFMVNIKIGFEGGFISDLVQSINYEQVYAIASKHMAHTRDLLEQVISHIIKEIEETSSGIKYAYISIQKLNPLFGKQIAATEVIFEKEYPN